MEYLIVTSHDVHDVYGQPKLAMSSDDKKKVEALASYLSYLFGGKSERIICAHQRNSFNSAQIIAKDNSTIKRSIILNPFLMGIEKRLEMTIAILEKSEPRIDIVVLIADEELAGILPREFCSRKFGKNKTFHSWPVRAGNAWLIDCRNEKLAKIELIKGRDLGFNVEIMPYIAYCPDFKWLSINT